VPIFSDADRLTPGGLQWKMSTNCAFFSLTRNWVFSCASPRCLLPWERDRRTKLRSFPRSLRGHRRDAVCGERTFGLIQNFALASRHKTGGVQVPVDYVVAATARALECRRFEASVDIVESQAVRKERPPLIIVLTNAVNAILAVNVILTIPGRLRRVRSLPTKEGVLTWEQCSRVLVPTKLLREPTEGGAGK
jgi:hypothetical protein